ncbi:MAG: hypothetical protein V1873_05855 [Verrucomicrobiota bacterium]
MMRKFLPLAVGLLLCGRAYGADLNMDWAYHDDNDGVDDRATENVPGQGVMFLGNAKLEIPDAEPVTLYVLTVNQFAGEAEEQVLVRWWNGTEEKWIMGGWLTNVWLGAGENDSGRFHGLPNDQSVMLDVWKVDVGSEVTMPGTNYYVIQLKGWAQDAAKESYLTRDSMGENGKVNNVNQSWTPAADYFNHDWSVTITP